MKRPESYNTKQREAVLSYIVSLNGGHVTAAQIEEHFKKSGVPIGLTTIYRHLDKLEARGLVKKYMIDGVSGACYQYIYEHGNCREHFHLKCEDCGELLHLQCGALDEIRRHISDEHSFKINTMKTVFYGKCNRCLGGD